MIAVWRALARGLHCPWHIPGEDARFQSAWHSQRVACRVLRVLYFWCFHLRGMHVRLEPYVTKALTQLLASP